VGAFIPRYAVGEPPHKRLFFLIKNREKIKFFSPFPSAKFGHPRFLYPHPPPIIFLFSTPPPLFSLTPQMGPRILGEEGKKTFYGRFLKPTQVGFNHLASKL